jgi:hypothetical protein
LNIPSDIEDARNLLEKAEYESDPKFKMIYLTDAIEIIDSYIDDPSIENDTTVYINNLKVSHTRRLLNQLVSLREIEIEVWLGYMLLLFTKLEDEVKDVTETDLALKKNLDSFKDVWKTELLEAAKHFEEKE